MVDVMLVLLIIFMVTAPLLTVGVDVESKGTLAPGRAAEDRGRRGRAREGAVERHGRRARENVPAEHRTQL